MSVREREREREEESGVCLKKCVVRVGRSLVSRPWNTQTLQLFNPDSPHITHDVHSFIIVIV